MLFGKAVKTESLPLHFRKSIKMERLPPLFRKTVFYMQRYIRRDLKFRTLNRDNRTKTIRLTRSERNIRGKYGKKQVYQFKSKTLRAKLNLKCRYSKSYISCKFVHNRLFILFYS